MASARRPEHQAPPEIFYNEEEAKKYTSNSRMIEIQSQMSERAIELLALPEDTPCFILDIGCGSGLSGQVLEEQGHCWIGVDISQAMLNTAKERDVEGDVILGDMGQGMCFRAGCFDGAISISALQWLCNADKRSHIPAKRLSKFFSMLYSCLYLILANFLITSSYKLDLVKSLSVERIERKFNISSRGSRAVFQFYPENSEQVELVTRHAVKAGFTGGLIIDYPNSTKAKKFFLVLFTGGSQKLPQALGTESTNSVQYTNKRERIKNARGKNLKKSKDWVLEKKERRRRQGKDVRPDTKYTGRRRSGKL